MLAVTVSLATPEQEGLVCGLLSAYLAELDVQSTYPYLSFYWQEPERFPYVIAADDEIVGFALVREVGTDPSFEMAEFYVMPGHRRVGIGRKAVWELFAIHRGSWQVNAMPSSAEAQAFWASVLSANSCLRNSSAAYVA